MNAAGTPNYPLLAYDEIHTGTSEVYSLYTEHIF